VIGKEKLGTRRQALLLGILGLVLVLAVVRWTGGGGGARSGAASRRPATDPAAPEERSPLRGSRGVREVAPDEVPLLSPADLEPRKGTRDVETSRDLFDFREPTPRPLPTPTPAPPPPPRPGDPAFVGPLPPPPPPPTPVPPEIQFRFIGSFGPKDRPIAVLALGDELVNARVGDVVFQRFILRRVGYESIDVGFVGYSPAETRRLAIAP
jgi:hypothetical protein